MALPNRRIGKSGKGRSYYKSTLVVVDEVGYALITREECNLFFRFIANRYKKNSVVINIKGSSYRLRGKMETRDNSDLQDDRKWLNFDDQKWLTSS